MRLFVCYYYIIFAVENGKIESIVATDEYYKYIESATMNLLDTRSFPLEMLLRRHDFMYYGKGQLCFTTHNLDPMSVLKNNRNSIDFLTSENEVISWKITGNAAPN